MNKNPITHAVVFGGCIVSLWLWNYLSGQFSFHYTVFFLLGTASLLLFTIFAFGCWVFGTLGNLSNGRFGVATLSVVLLGVFGWLPFLIHLNPYLLGVRQQISSRMTPAQIRQAAFDAALAGNKDGRLSRFGLSWSKVPGPYGVVVGLDGCAVCGHTGLQVQEPVITNRYSRGDHLNLAPDIEVFYDPR